MAQWYFLKAETVDGVLGLKAIPGQKFSDGTMVDAAKVITLRDNYDFIEAGMIVATNALTLKSKGWYVVGTQFYQITDEVDLIINDATDPGQIDAINAYRDFSNGGATVKAASAPVGFKTDNLAKAEPTLVQKLRFDKKLKPPTIEGDGWYVDEGLWYHLMRQILKNKNTLLVGPSGGGKTELAMLVASRLHKPFQDFDMAVSNPNKTFCGNLRAENGSTYFKLARFAREMRNENLMLMDELNRAAPTANNIFFPVTDRRRTMYIEDAIDENDVQIKAHEKTSFWATANIGSQYIGTSTLDHALLNRFSPLAVEYAPKDKESLVLQARTKISKKDADQIVAVAHSIRTAQDLSKDVSTRQMIEVAEMVYDGYSKSDAFKYGVVQQFQGDEHDGGERAIVLGIIQRH